MRVGEFISVALLGIGLAVSITWATGQGRYAQAIGARQHAADPAMPANGPADWCRTCDDRAPVAEIVAHGRQPRRPLLFKVASDSPTGVVRRLDGLPKGTLIAFRGPAEPAHCAGTEDADPSNAPQADKVEK